MKLQRTPSVTRPRSQRRGTVGAQMAGLGVLLGLFLAGCDARSRNSTGTDIIVCDHPKVSDGDTISLCGVHVRIMGINSPEIAHPNLNIPEEPGGRAAAARMAELARGQVSCEPAGDQHDRYGRTVGRCWTATTPDLGAEMIREGYACQWKRYSHGAYDGLGRDCDRHGK